MFNWLNYLYLARWLVGWASKPPNQEAKQRAAISRAYYAAFVLARNYLRDTDQLRLPYGTSLHTFVIAQFNHSSVEIRQDLGDALETLRKYRNFADYQDSVNNLPFLTRESLRLAEEIIETLNRL